MDLRISAALNSHAKAINGSSILFLGVASNPNIDDISESYALNIMDIVAQKGGKVSYYDPSISEVVTPEGRKFQCIDDSKSLAPRPPVTPSIHNSITLSLLAADCVVITTNHSVFEAEMIQRNAKLIVDLRNVIKESSDSIYKL